MHYTICDIFLDSNIVFPELFLSQKEETTCTFRLIRVQQNEADQLAWFHHWRLPNGSIWLSLARCESGYVLRFPGIADFNISKDGTFVQCYPILGIPDDTIRHLFLNQVVPLILSMQGKLVLHASAVAVGEGAIAFVGKTGEGKSTLATIFSMKGFSFITDDCLLLMNYQEHLLVNSSYPSIRLWDDVVERLFGLSSEFTNVAHFTEKKRVSVEGGGFRFSEDPLPLKRVYFLGRSDKGDTNNIKLTPMSARESFIELLSCAFRIDIEDKSMLVKHFNEFNKIAKLPIFCRLTFPRDFSMLSAVHRVILRDFYANC